MPRSPFETPATKPGLLARITSPTGLAVAVLAGVTLGFYHGLWLPGLALIKRDAYGVFPQVKRHIIERLAAGELPQWFPYDGLGRSLIGVTHTGSFHPFTALYILFPAPDAYRLATLLSCLLASLGAFMLGRTLGLSRMGALLAGLSFALSGYVVSITDNIVYLYSLCLLPIFCLALEKALVGARAWAAAPAAVWATVFWNGDVQTGYYYGFIALLWMAARARGPCLDTGLRMAFTTGLAALLAGIQLGPAWATFATSDRAHPALFLSQALQWSTHPLRLATVLAAPVGEEAGPAGLARLLYESPTKGLWAESLYLGAPVIGLALLGAQQRRDLRVLALLGALALVLALGRYGGLYEFLYHVAPLWSAFRYPEKFMGLFSFAAAMLAGAGIDALRAGQGRRLPWLTAALLFAAAGISLRTDAATAWLATGFEGAEPLARAVAGSAAQALFFSALAALGVGLAVTGIQRGTWRVEFLLAVLIALTTLDLARANMGAYHTGPVEASTFTPPLADALRAREGSLTPGRFRLVTLEDRWVSIPEPLEQMLGHSATFVERRQALDGLHSAEFHIEAAHPYLPGFTDTLTALLRRGISLQAAARLNVAYYIGRRYHLKDPRLAKGLVAELPPYDLALFQNPVPAKSRAYLSLKPERTAAPVNPAALLARPDFLSGAVDVIETSDATVPGPAQEGLAVIERYDHEDVRVRVETPQPAVLILLDAYEQGWTATLDGGAELPILRANALMRAVIVPAGSHVIAFSYRTPWLKAGAWASLTGVLLCLGLIAHAQRQRRRPGDHV
jgi:hypothetical protein